MDSLESAIGWIVAIVFRDIKLEQFRHCQPSQLRINPPGNAWAHGKIIFRSYRGRCRGPE